MCFIRSLFKCLDDQIGLRMEMFRGSKQKDIVRAYNMVIDGYVRIGQIARGEDLLCEMKENKLVPTTVTYTTIMNGYGRNGNLQCAQRVFSEMRQEGLEGDRVTMNTLPLSAQLSTAQLAPYRTAQYLQNFLALQAPALCEEQGPSAQCCNSS